jgi:hypothetical protein
MKEDIVQLRIEGDLTNLINRAARRTGLSKSEVMRQGLRRGVPEVMRALDNGANKTLIDALLDLKGLEIPERKHRFKRRV